MKSRSRNITNAGSELIALAEKIACYTPSSDYVERDDSSFDTASPVVTLLPPDDPTITLKGTSIVGVEIASSNSVIGNLGRATIAIHDGKGRVAGANLLEEDDGNVYVILADQASEIFTGRTEPKKLNACREITNILLSMHAQGLLCLEGELQTADVA